ncbi:MAG: Uma2 family endonuclease [Bacteroidota bacterium]
MLTAEKKKKYTIEDYLLLEEGAPFQLIENDLIISPSPNPAHQLISGRILQAMMNFLDAINDNGFLVAAPMDVVFDGDNAFQPDILYITAERKAEIVKERILGAPDMIIEILSPSNAYYDLRQKKDIYEKYGVKEYIIIDPIQETAELYTIVNNAYQFQQKATKAELLNSLVIPGFSFDLKKLFR